MNHDKEFIALLELLEARDRLEETARLFDRSLRSWDQYSEEERKWILEKAASLKAGGTG